MNIIHRTDNEPLPIRSQLRQDHGPLLTKTHLTLPAPRVAFYSHDTMGMGHLRRNMLIASALSAGACQADTLLIAGTREAGFFAEQAGLDCVTLPALTKRPNGQYSARHYAWSLEETARLRGRIIASTLLAFRPDILVVDKLPQGICSELQRALRLIRNRLGTRCILGLRDVLDEPHVAIREWQTSANDEIIERYFDEVWVYGDPSVYDCRAEYHFAQSTLERLQFTGYLDQSSRLPQFVSSDEQSQPLALCVVGGGQDGVQLAQAFVDAGVPRGWQGAVITGPFMPPAHKHELKQAVLRSTRASGPIRIIDQLVESDHLLRSATRVVAMGGYNTIMSILSFRKPAMIVPRTAPRAEQWIRASRLAAARLITAVHPNNLSSQTIRTWLETPDVADPSQHAIDLRGLERIQSRVQQFTRFTPCCT
jgi:predicted glycosyltransferase